MNFTKEEIETAKKINEIYLETCFLDKRDEGGFHNFDEFCDSLLKPATKKIVVEIEYQLNKFGGEVILYEHNILECLTGEGYWSSVLKVTELPEVFTREDITDLKNYFFSKTAYDKGFISDIVNDWLSERNLK